MSARTGSRTIKSLTRIREWPLTTMCVGVTKTAQREGQRGEREKGKRHR